MARSHYADITAFPDEKEEAPKGLVVQRARVGASEVVDLFRERCEKGEDKPREPTEPVRGCG